MVIGFGDDIVAQLKGHVGGVRHRLDAGRVDAPHVFDQREDAGQLAEHLFCLIFGNRDAGKMGHAFYVFDCQRHGVAEREIPEAERGFERSVFQPES